jgi:hypothetical protein
MRMDIEDPDRKSDDIDVNDKQRKERVGSRIRPLIWY